jgi:aspartate beta-hydroxylase
MRDDRFHHRWRGKALYTAMWGLLRVGAIRQGIDPGKLERVRAYLKFRYRLDHPRPADPFQRPRHFFPGLAARPWHEAADFAWTAPIDESAETIRDELVGLLDAQTFVPYRRDLALQGEWTTYMLWSFGLPFRDNLARCPRTAELLDSLSISHTAGLTYFSALGPRTHVAAHCGPTNTRLRCHLGIVVPDGCRIRVGSTTRTWEAGRCIVFDDSFEHEVWNDGDRHRYVLILDVWHPDLTPAEVWALTEVERLSLYTSQRGRRTRALR